jgi:hypothetical protein
MISASLNGTTRQSPMLMVTAGPAIVLTSLTLSASTVVGGDPVMGTVALSGGAPAGGAVVSLSSGDPATVPASVTVAAGVAGATFRVTTRAVGGSMPATINASYGGTSTTATLIVTPVPPPTVAIARFGVTGPTETDTCTLADNGNTLNCTFNGSTSVAPGTITAWDWSFGVANTITKTTSGPILTMPAMSCALMPPPPLPLDGPQWFTLVVTLTIHDSLGNVSAKTVDDGIRLIPHGSCGF